LHSGVSSSYAPLSSTQQDQRHQQHQHQQQERLNGPSPTFHLLQLSPNTSPLSSPLTPPPTKQGSLSLLMSQAVTLTTSISPFTASMSSSNSDQNLYDSREKKEFNVSNIWAEVEKKIKVVDDHIQWSDLVNGINEAINLLYISLYPSTAQYGGIYYTAQEGEEFKRIRGDHAGSKIPLAEYKFLWLKHIESYLRALTKIPHTWFGTPKLFHGPMSREKSEKLLSTCKIGTLIIRYTCKKSAICLFSSLGWTCSTY